MRWGNTNEGGDQLKTIEEQLILHEGLRLKVYKCPAGKWTIGVGRNLEAKGLTKEEQEKILGTSGLSKLEVIDALLGMGISKEDALFLLANDIADCKRDLERYDWYTKLDPVRQKVLIDMRLNLGMAGLLDFKRMIVALAAQDYEAAAKEMIDSRWYVQVGNRSKRLVTMMFDGEDYEF